MAKRFPIMWADAKAGDFAVAGEREFVIEPRHHPGSRYLSVRGHEVLPETLNELGFTCEREVKEEPKVWKFNVGSDPHGGRLVRMDGPEHPPVGGDIWVSTREPLTFKEEE